MSNPVDHYPEFRHEIDHIAESIRSAARDRSVLDPVRNLVSDPSESLATAIRDVNIQHWVSEGRAILGYKVGLTATAIQEQFSVDAPAYGCLFTDMVVRNGGSIGEQDVPQLWAEAELALVLRNTIDHPDPTLTDILASIDYGLPAIELASTRILDWDLSLFDYLADNGAASHLVLGETPIDIHSCDVSTLTMKMLRNGEEASTGTGEAVLGSPLNSLLWLAKKKIEDGEPLKMGEIVMTGAMGPVVTGRAGDNIEVRIGSAEPVSISIV